jgi:ATP-dependent DNA helicase DinG
VSSYRVEELARDTQRLEGALTMSSPTVRDSLARAVERLRDAARAFFAAITLAHRVDDRIRGEERIRITATSLAPAADAGADLTGTIDLLEQALALVGLDGPGAAEAAAAQTDGGEDDRLRDDVASLARRAGVLRASPIDVSAIVRELLLERMRTTVLTSATLTVDGTFEYVRRRLGIGRAEEVRLPSEFDFEQQAILYLPPRMPDPRSSEFAIAAGRQVVEILKRTHGRAFILFTSYATMRAVQAIAEMGLDYPIFVQGTAPRSQILNQFRQTPHAVLFATSSFWQGVDVVGEALSCVIIDKLPFASPGDPVTAARIDRIRDEGGDPFGEYQVPLAILTLRQGLGRLIRHRRDRGVLAILDPRLRTKGYGRRFAASLPPARVVSELAAITDFFTGKARLDPR